MVCQSRPYHFNFFKGCLPQSSLDPFLNTLYHIQMHSDKVVSMTTLLHLFQKPVTPRQTKESHVSIIRSYGLIQHIALAPKQMLEGYS